jgi:sulfite reductase beta subunit-like hemoprotein
MGTHTESSLAGTQGFEDQYDSVVRQEIETFRAKAKAHLAGEVSDADFRPFRLKHGIYGQRQPGVQMVRCKIPGGLATAAQVRQFARIADEFAGGRGHLTTRQNIQFHFVPLDRVADLMTLLADAGLTNREACYNTVRNVTACPFAGLAGDEVFDVRPYAQRLAFAFLRQELTGNLPRKFKFAFEGCANQDCIQGAINDVGLRAVIRDGRRGFRAVIAGGLGPLPTEAQLLSEFIPEEELLPWCEAILRVFNQHGNRENKNTARMKFVLRTRGLDWMKEQIAKEHADIVANGGIAWPEGVPEGFGGYQAKPNPLGDGALLPVVGQPTPSDPAYAGWLRTNVRPQRQTGYAAVTATVHQGNLTGDQLRGLAQIAEASGDGLVRASIIQNLMLAFVPLAKLPQVYAALSALGLATAGAGEIADVLTCPGAYTCNLGITKTMNLGAALHEAVRGYDDPRVRELTIKASGCPNSCGHHWIGDFGFYGNVRKNAGREIPYYQMLLGGGYDDQGIMRFGLAIQAVPARLAPEAVRRVIAHFQANRLDGERFRDYVLRFKVETFRALTADLAKPADLFPEIYQDWGDSDAFSLKLGRGECAV